ncbi:MAG: ATP-dependent Clp protease adaptor ClpS [Victivallaceae bacterium]|nr:ATP-dependent Clp protease adaptor ClpS [Victivallaceae bacterium]
MAEFEEKYIEKVIDQLKEPKLYKVFLVNDDYSTMDFVIMVLMSIFHKSQSEANSLMATIHKTGHGVCGVYPFEVAETKVAQVAVMAEKYRFPLQGKLEED